MRRRSASDSPWLFGNFSVADAIIAPVAGLLHIRNEMLLAVSAADRNAS